MAADGIMSLLFGKKKQRRTRRKTTTKTKKVSRKKIGYTMKKGRMCIVYKYKGLTGRRYSNKRKLSKGKKLYKTKAACKRACAKKSKKVSRKKTTRRRSTRSSFGTGGSYMPLESFMSPYPYSVDSSPPWI